MSVDAPVRPAYRNGGVLRWLSAYTAAVTGDVIYFLTLSWTVADIAGPATAGLVLGLGAIPRAVLLLGGGVVVDRFGPRRVAIWSDATRFVVISVVAVAVLIGPPQVWFLAAVALVFGVVDALFMPAAGAFPPRLVESRQLVSVQGMRGLSIRTSNLIGPLLGGVMLASSGAGGGFGTAAVMFGVSVGLLMMVRLRPGVVYHDPAGAGLRAGWRYLRAHRSLFPLITVIGLSEMCFSGPVGAGLVLLAGERGWGPGGMAWISAAFSIGGAIGALTLTLVVVRRTGVAVVVALVATAVSIAGVGLVDGLAVAAMLGAITGLTSGVTQTITQAMIQTAVPAAYLGRVTALTSLFTLGLAPILLPAVGFVIGTWGASVFFIGCGVVCVIAASVAGFARTLRQAELVTG